MFLSLIVPTRGRPEQLRRFLDSLAHTLQEPEGVEVVLVVDADDSVSAGIGHSQLQVRHILGPPGRTMGQLNQAGYEASNGRFLMLLNDDVVARTPGWDETIYRVTRFKPDGILLVHVNDWVFQTQLCTFPLVSRTFCDMVGGLCPPAYKRYRIDDHIEDYFNMLAYLGERRTFFLPDVVFEHLNYEPHPTGIRQYFSADQGTLAEDATLFDSLEATRKEITLKLMQSLHPMADWDERNNWSKRLLEVADPFALRVPERLRFVTRRGEIKHWPAQLGESGCEGRIDECDPSPRQPQEGGRPVFSMPEARRSITKRRYDLALIAARIP